jgi:hypothetical protein
MEHLGFPLLLHYLELLLLVGVDFFIKRLWGTGVRASLRWSKEGEGDPDPGSWKGSSRGRKKVGLDVMLGRGRKQVWDLVELFGVRWRNEEFWRWWRKKRVEIEHLWWWRGRAYWTPSSACGGRWRTWWGTICRKNSHSHEQELLLLDLRVEDDNLGAGGGGAGKGQHQLKLGIGEKLWCQDFLFHVLLRSWGGVGWCREEGDWRQLGACGGDCPFLKGESLLLKKSFSDCSMDTRRSTVLSLLWTKREKDDVPQEGEVL